jgi:hypothetical protein
LLWTLLALAPVLSRVEAHNLDQYLQAAVISVDQSHIAVSMRLVPGVAVAQAVLAGIETDAGGAVSQAGQRSYITHLQSDLSLRLDGVPVPLRWMSAEFPTVDQMRAGLGEIRVEFSADVLPGDSRRRLTFENHHRREISAYLVNCLVPRDPDIQIVAQSRNSTQSFYELDYRQIGGGTAAPLLMWWHGLRTSLSVLGEVPGMFRLGMRHIAEGTDHLLFLLTLLLPAPLMIRAGRWADGAGVRRSLLQIVKVVTAFTVGHSVTLVLAAIGLVHVPSRPVEVLIAVSIFVSALHALRPLFPGREAFVAAFFGLIHGLAFATTLGQLQLGRAGQVTVILGFNLGIETMQMIVVGVTMPSLLLMSRTRSYTWLRVGGGLFAAAASAGWILQRLFGIDIPVDTVLDSLAGQAGWLGLALFLAALGSWLAWPSSHSTSRAVHFITQPYGLRRISCTPRPSFLRRSARSVTPSA